MESTMFGQTVHSAFPYSRYFYPNKLCIVYKNAAEAQ